MRPIPSGRTRTPSTAGRVALAILVFVLLGAGACALPGARSKNVQADSLGNVLARCTEAVEGMHFTVKAVDRSHHIVIAEGKVEGGLTFHDIRLSIKVVHLGGQRYKVEAIATADEKGIRAGAEKKARKLFFRELGETGIQIES